MVNELINGVYHIPLPVIVTTGGSVMHAVKGFDEDLPAFGECYFSTAAAFSPKAWKKHSAMVCNLFVPHGAIKFVFFDDRADSRDYGKLVEFSLSKENYGRLVIRPGIWFGFASIHDGEDSIILNVANIRHDPLENQRLEPGTNEIPYTWTF